jgi:hypothetical protein
MIQETEDMIKLVKSSKYKGDQTEIDICFDYIKDLKKHKLKKIKSIKEKGDKKIKDYVKTKKDDNKISLDKEEDKKDYNEWVDIDDDMNEKGEILIEKNNKTSFKDSEIKINVNKKDEKPNPKEKNAKIKFKDSEIDDYKKEKEKMVNDLLIYSEMNNNLNERQEKLIDIENNAERLARESEMYVKAAKKLKKNKFMSWISYKDNDNDNDNDFEAEEINKSKIVCYISLILIIIAIIVTLIILFFH